MELIEAILNPNFSLKCSKKKLTKPQKVERRQISRRKKCRPRAAGARHGLARTHGRAWLLPLQHGHVAWCTAVRCFALFPTPFRGFVRLLIFLETASKVFISVKTHEFLLKVRQNAF